MYRRVCVCVLFIYFVLGGRCCSSPRLALEKSLMLVDETLEEERKIPLKLRRWGDLGKEVWWEGKGKMVLGETEVVCECSGADWGHGGRWTGLISHPALVGLADRIQRSPWRKRWRVIKKIRITCITYYKNFFLNLMLFTALLGNNKNFGHTHRPDWLGKKSCTLHFL